MKQEIVYIYECNKIFVYVRYYDESIKHSGIVKSSKSPGTRHNNIFECMYNANIQHIWCHIHTFINIIYEERKYVYVKNNGKLGLFII